MWCCAVAPAVLPNRIWCCAVAPAVLPNSITLQNVMLCRSTGSLTQQNHPAECDAVPKHQQSYPTASPCRMWSCAVAPAVLPNSITLQNVKLCCSTSSLTHSITLQNVKLCCSTSSLTHSITLQKTSILTILRLQNQHFTHVMCMSCWFSTDNPYINLLVPNVDLSWRAVRVFKSASQLNVDL